MAHANIKQFGKDHWSMFAYVETLCVDGKEGVGTIDLRKARCNENTHPLLAANAAATKWKTQYSTRLAGFFDFADRNDAEKAIEAGLMLRDHDDWDCLDDIAEAGLVEILSMTNGLVKMTDYGNEVAGKLRTHKANGGMFAGFKLEETSSPKVKP